MLAGLLSTIGWQPSLRPRQGDLAILGASTIVFILTLHWQTNGIDDDYWIHTPLQAQVMRSGLPPSHPFFPEIQMGGHFGRDLLIAGTAVLIDAEPLTVQLWMTAFSQAASFVLLSELLKDLGVSGQGRLLSICMAWFGVCVGGRSGLLDTYQNNNSLSYLLTFASLRQAQELLTRPSLGAAVRLTATLSSLSITYETHWGLVLLTVATLAVCQKRRTNRRNRWLVAALAGSLIMPMWLGGAAQGLLKPKSAELTIGELNHHQVVTITFPKERFGEAMLYPRHTRSTSLAFDLFSSKRSAGVSSVDGEYVSLLSPQMLQQHWLGTWFAPIAVLLAFRRRNRALTMLTTFALFSYVTPGLVDFGPIYEMETFRWAFAAALFFAISFGVSWDECSRHQRRVLAALVILCVAPGLYGQRARFALLTSSLGWQNLVSANHAHTYIASQPKLALHVDLLSAARFLQEKAYPADSIVTDFDQSHSQEIIRESTFLGLARLISVGHTLPSRAEPVGTAPYRYSSWHRAFWDSPNPGPLHGRSADWILLSKDNPEISKKLATVPGVSLIDSGANRLYRYEETNLPFFELTPYPNSIEIIGHSDGRVVSPGALAYLIVDFQSQLEADTTLSIRFTRSDSIEGDPREESYLWVLGTGRSRHVVPIALPSYPGRYELDVSHLRQRWLQSEVRVAEPFEWTL